MNVIIQNNFLTFPKIVREWVLKQPFYTAQQFTEMYGKHTDWPGKRTQHVYDLDNEYGDIVLGKIAEIAVNNFGLKNVSIRSYFQITTQEDGDSWIHQDNDTDIAAVLYLNPDPPENSGTTLYKCNNVDKWTSFMSDQEGYQTLKTINRIDNKQLHDELFTEIDTIGNVFNRLIMYRGTEYHKSNNYFGKSIEDGRLIQVFFIKGEK